MKSKIFLILVIILYVGLFIGCSGEKTNVESAGQNNISTIQEDNEGYQPDVEDGSIVDTNLYSLKLSDSNLMCTRNDPKHFKFLLGHYIDNVDDVNLEKIFFAKDYYESTSTLYCNIPDDLVLLRSNIDIKIPNKIKYINFMEDDRYEVDQKWVKYFKSILEKEEGENNTPLIIREAWIFEWNGSSCAIVNANNTILGSQKTENTQSAIIDSKNMFIYNFSALFIEQDIIIDLLQPISFPVSDYFIYEKDRCNIYNFIYSNVNTNILQYPLYFDHGADLSTRQYQYSPYFLLLEIDDNIGVELIQLNDGTGLTESILAYSLNSENLTINQRVLYPRKDLFSK